MSRIEQLIGEIEEYIDSCKPQAFSNTKIVVNKEELEELLVELRLRIPDEIKKYQKIISQEDAILNEARSQASAMLEEANAQTNELINEHEIMQKAYAQANQIIEEAQAQAQQIVDSAVADADNIRQSSIDYTDDMLKSLQTIIRHSMDEAGGYFNSLQSSLQSSYDIVTSNREELSGSVSAVQEEEA
ncbi:MAG: vacuolar family H+-ATPase subunit H [Clostridiales bacterium]|nr:vacuolar family H+-ATPase subunit H [Clostridiales bacterium]